MDWNYSKQDYCDVFGHCIGPHTVNVGFCQRRSAILIPVVQSGTQQSMRLQEPIVLILLLLFVLELIISYGKVHAAQIRLRSVHFHDILIL